MTLFWSQTWDGVASESSQKINVFLQWKTLEHHVDCSVIFYVPHWCFVTFWNVWELSYSIPFHRTWKIRATGVFPSPKLRCVAGFFCNGEIGAPGLTKPSDDLAEREQVRATKMDGWVFLSFLETKKWWNSEKLRWMFTWRRELHLIFVLHMYLCLCFYLQIYIRGGGFGFNQDVGWFYNWVDAAWVKTAGFTTRWGPCLYTASPLSSRFSVMAVCVCVCHGKMYKGLSTSESLGLLWLCFCIF